MLEGERKRKMERQKVKRGKEEGEGKGERTSERRGGQEQGENKLFGISSYESPDPVTGRATLSGLHLTPLPPRPHLQMPSHWELGSNTGVMVGNVQSLATSVGNPLNGQLNPTQKES